MNLELYTNNLSPFAQMVELLLETKEVDCSRTLPQRDFVREGGFGEVNPLRKVPVLVVDGVATPETQVIFELVEELYPTPSLLPVDPLARSRVRLLSRTADVYLASPSVQLLNNAFDSRSSEIAAYAQGMIERGLRGLEAWLAPGPFATGEERSHADCVLPPVLYFMKEILPGMGVEGIPAFGENTAGYYEAILTDDKVAQCVSRMAAALRERTAQAK